MSSYDDVKIGKDQDLMINSTPLEIITGCIMENIVGAKDLRLLTQKG